MSYIVLVVAALCAGLAILRAVLVRRGRGNMYWVVLMATYTICLLAASLGLPPLRDQLPAQLRLDATLALAIVGAVVILGGQLVLVLLALRARRTVRD